MTKNSVIKFWLSIKDLLNHKNLLVNKIWITLISNQTNQKYREAPVQCLNNLSQLRYSRSFNLA